VVDGDSRLAKLFYHQWRAITPSGRSPRTRCTTMSRRIVPVPST